MCTFDKLFQFPAAKLFLNWQIIFIKPIKKLFYIRLNCVDSFQYQNHFFCISKRIVSKEYQLKFVLSWARSNLIYPSPWIKLKR